MEPDRQYTAPYYMEDGRVLCVEDTFERCTINIGVVYGGPGDAQPWAIARLTARLNGFVYARLKTSSRFTTRLDGDDNTWRVFRPMLEVVFDDVYDIEPP